MAQMRIKGLTLKSRIQYVDQFYGKDALASIMKYLRPETAAVLAEPRKVRATAWYDLRVQVDLDQTIYRHLAKSDAGIYKKLGAFSAEFQSVGAGGHAISDPWKMFQMVGSVFDRYFSPGRLEIIKVNDKEVMLRLFEFRSVKENCLSNLGFLSKSLELNGFKPTIVEETVCSEDPSAKYCEYHIGWK